MDVGSATAPAASRAKLPRPATSPPATSSVTIGLKKSAPTTAVLFISRRNKRRILNEADLVRLCSRLPAAIRLGGCSLLELGMANSTAEVVAHDAALRRARVLVGTFGAGLTNALFLDTWTVAPAVSETCDGVSSGAVRTAVLEIVPHRFEESCPEWSQFYRTRFRGRVAHWRQLLTVNASRSSISCRYLPRRLLPQYHNGAVPAVCASEQWLNRIPRGSVNCHIAADPERLALVIRDQDTVVDVDGFERALIEALSAVEEKSNHASH